MEKNVCIVNFNTTELTASAIHSLWKNTPDCSVTVFDNSDVAPFKMDGVRIIDNTKGQLINFDEFLERFPKKGRTSNKHASVKHSLSIQKLFEYCPDGFVLLDSDVLIKKDISSLFDESVICSGEIERKEEPGKRRPPRLEPYICWINVPLCRKLGISYFDSNRSWKLFRSRNSCILYDTGASFLEDCWKSGENIREITCDEFIVHLRGGSWKGKNSEEFLEKYKSLYLNTL